MEKSPGAYRTISEVADELKLPQHVLRFWETRFPQIKPLKRGGNRRFYRPDDVDLLRAIKTLLYGDGFTIKGVQRILKEQGPRAVATLAQSGQLRSSVRRHSQGAFEPPDTIASGETETLVEPAETRMPRGSAAVARVRPDASIELPVRRLESPEGRDRASAEAAPGDLADRLQAVLFELSECERILAAARG